MRQRQSQLQGPGTSRFRGLLLIATLEVVAVSISVLIAALISQDGESYWMEGVQLLAVYVILGIAFFNLPG